MSVGKSLAVILLVPVSIAACSSLPQPQPVSYAEYSSEQTRYPGGKLFGEGGLTLGGGKSSNSGTNQDGAALGVNAYLWRGTLDTLSFMPLVSADPFGGVIITDWYQPPTSNGERFKATAYILGRQLRADGIRISIFRQVLTNGQWTDAPMSPETVGEIENKVLERARELREQSASN